MEDYIIEEKQIKIVGDPLVRFTEDPLLILQAVRAAAEEGLPLHKATKDAIPEKRELLKTIDISGIRQEFEKIITAEFAGKGLKMLLNARLMQYIIGDLADYMTKWSVKQLAILAENIDKTKRIKERRLGLFYLCFEKKQAFEAINLLKYDIETRTRLTDALNHLDALNFLATKEELKRFLSRRGRESYEYLDGLSKAQRIVYDLHESKILSRQYLMQLIQNNDEPIYLEDLSIDKNDIIENGIATGGKADQILEELLDLVHRQPGLNSKKTLLKSAVI